MVKYTTGIQIKLIPPTNVQETVNKINDQLKDKIKADIGFTWIKKGVGKNGLDDTLSEIRKHLNKNPLKVRIDTYFNQGSLNAQLTGLQNKINNSVGQVQKQVQNSAQQISNSISTNVSSGFNSSSKDLESSLSKYTTIAKGAHLENKTFIKETKDIKNNYVETYREMTGSNRDLETTTIKNYEAFEKLKRQLNSFKNINLSKIDSAISKAGKFADPETLRRLNDLKEQLGDLSVNKNLPNQMTDINSKISVATTKLKDFSAVNKEQSKVQTDYWNKRRVEALDSLTAKPDGLKQMANYYKELESSSKKQAEQEVKMTKLVRDQSLAREKMLETIRRMRGVDGNYIQGDNLTALNNLENRVKTLSPISPNFENDIKRADADLNKIKTTTSIFKKEVQDASKFTGIFGQSLLEAGKKFAGWLFMGTIIMQTVHAIQFGIDSMQELDKAMIELRKVTNGTAQEYDKFFNSAMAVGNALGRNTQEVINASAEWARLGYSIQDALKLGEETLVLANVGMLDVNQSTQYLISTMRGFSMEAQDARKIVDQLNEVGDNYSITQEGIGEALKRSSASMAAANNSLAETIALISVANNVTQDAEMVGKFAPLYSNI